MNSGDRDGPAEVIPTDVQEDKPVLVERRRPARAYYTNQALIALLRRPGGDVSKEDRGSPARGIIIGLGISAILWSMIGLIFWVVLRRW